LGPWFSINAVPRLTATNTLYVGAFRRRVKREEMAALGLSLLTSEASDRWSERVRNYPDGLLKFEPSDYSNLLVPSPRTGSGTVRVYCTAVGHLLAGRCNDARSIADAWVQSGRCERP